ncbi:MAG: GTPase Era [Bacteroidota bacterium]
MEKHYSGFINIVGRPNVGKSTLMNALVGERMAIITNKPQTTRHRLIGIVNTDQAQMVFSDTPGIIHDPSYKMQLQMNRYVMNSFEDADIVLFMTEPAETYGDDDFFLNLIRKAQVPVYLVLNKIDTIEETQVLELLKTWNERIEFTESFPISALHKLNTENLMKTIESKLPEGPAYYPKDQFTDKPERFFVSEIIREKILLQYHQEIPYASEVVVNRFKVDEQKPLIRIQADIYVMRKTQKSIIIGKGGSSIKKLGMAARKDIETFLDSPVYLELFVKVKDNWRDDERQLKHFGYQS